MDRDIIEFDRFEFYRDLSDKRFSFVNERK